MKLHTSLSYAHVYAALRDAQRKGRVSDAVAFAQLDEKRSNSHERGWEIQLGADRGDQSSLPPNTRNQYGKPQKTRRVRNSNVRPDLKWSATWDEWGWFIAEIYRKDPKAVFGNVGSKYWGYKGATDFHRQTNDRFRVLAVADKFEPSVQIRRPATALADVDHRDLRNAIDAASVEGTVTWIKNTAGAPIAAIVPVDAARPYADWRASRG